MAGGSPPDCGSAPLPSPTRLPSGWAGWGQPQLPRALGRHATALGGGPRLSSAGLETALALPCLFLKRGLGECLFPSDSWTCALCPLLCFNSRFSQIPSRLSAEAPLPDHRRSVPPPPRATSGSASPGTRRVCGTWAFFGPSQKVLTNPAELGAAASFMPLSSCPAACRGDGGRPLPPVQVCSPHSRCRAAPFSPGSRLGPDSNAGTSLHTRGPEAVTKCQSQTRGLGGNGQRVRPPYHGDAAPGKGLGGAGRVSPRDAPVQAGSHAALPASHELVQPPPPPGTLHTGKPLQGMRRVWRERATRRSQDRTRGTS